MLTEGRTPARLVHVINCLSVGGAERMLVRLAKATDRAAFETHVVTLLDWDRRETLAPELERAGFAVHRCGLDPRRPGPRALLRLRSLLREIRPDVVQSWLYHANAAATLARCNLDPMPGLAWNIRQSVADLRDEPRGMRTAIRLNAWLSRRPDVIVNNSARSAADHRALGFRPRREEIVPNGIDMGAFAPAPGAGTVARDAARRLLGITDDATVVAAAGRSHPMKDHPGLIDAFGRIAGRRADALLLIAGRDVDDTNEPLLAAIATAGLSARVRLLGERLDLPRLYPAFDCFVSSSARGEGFPNVIAEAMASGVPVVATDVGDTSELVGGAGTIVPPGDPMALAAAIETTLGLDPAARLAGIDAARDRIARRYDIGAIARRYEAIWKSIAPRSHSAKSASS